jgi:hypothetical protein
MRILSFFILLIAVPFCLVAQSGDAVDWQSSNLNVDNSAQIKNAISECISLVPSKDKGGDTFVHGLASHQSVNYGSNPQMPSMA